MLIDRRNRGLLYSFIIFSFILCPLLANGWDLSDKNISWIKKKNIHNIRLQFRKEINCNRIDNENDFQVTYFSSLPHRVFLFSNTEVIYEGTSYYSSNFEVNVSRPFYLDSPAIKTFSWIARLQMENHKRSLLSFGVQWDITDMPFFIDIAKKYKSKVFLQIFPIKSHDEQGTTDLYLYYTFPITQSIYVRGFGRYFFEYEANEDYNLLVQDIILPISKNWDFYGRYSYYNMERNRGISLGIRYLFRF